MIDSLGSLGEIIGGIFLRYKYFSILQEMGTAPALLHFYRELSRHGDPFLRQQISKQFYASPASQVAAGIEAILFGNPRQVS